jgi:outer membrane murein-binding lipoprotein Lpp
MAFSLPGLVIMVLGAVVVAFIGGKAKETVEGLATKVKSLTGKSEG